MQDIAFETGLKLWVGMVGAVGKISAFRSQGPQFYPGFAEI